MAAPCGCLWCGGSGGPHLSGSIADHMSASPPPPAAAAHSSSRRASTALLHPTSPHNKAAGSKRGSRSARPSRLELQLDNEQLRLEVAALRRHIGLRSALAAAGSRKRKAKAEEDEDSGDENLSPRAQAILRQKSKELARELDEAGIRAAAPPPASTSSRPRTPAGTPKRRRTWFASPQLRPTSPPSPHPIPIPKVQAGHRRR